MPDTPISLANNPAITSSQNISFTWSPGASNGGTVVLDYSIFYEQATDVWQPLAVNYLTTSYTTTTGLLPGKTYNFKVYARNSVGLSLPATVSILAAQIPDVPGVPTTVVSGSNVIISWAAPIFDGASPLTSYTILIRQSDEVTYSTQLTNCNGATNAVLSFRTCSVPISVLRSNPFNIAWGGSINAKVSATNVVGTSAYSSNGNGAIILTVTDPPVNLANVVTITSGSQIGLTWAPGVNVGGTPLIDYRLTYD